MSYYCCEISKSWHFDGWCVVPIHRVFPGVENRHAFIRFGVISTLQLQYLFIGAASAFTTSFWVVPFLYLLICVFPLSCDSTYHDRIWEIVGNIVIRVAVSVSPLMLAELNLGMFLSQVANHLSSHVTTSLLCTALQCIAIFHLIKLQLINILLCPSNKIQIEMEGRTYSRNAGGFGL